MLDTMANDYVRKTGMYPKTLIEELYAGAFHLIRNFELAPFANDNAIENAVADLIETGKL